MKPIRNEDATELIALISDREIHRKFLDTRKLFLWGPVDDESSERLVKEMLYLQEKDPDRDIELFINSPGGVISAGLAIYDCMQALRCDVRTICTGQAASMGAVLLAAGAHGKRFCWPHARVMIHQPLIHGRMVAPASDLEIQAEEMLRIRDELNRILAKHCGKSVEEVSLDTDRDKFMSAEEAVAYGLADDIVGV